MQNQRSEWYAGLGYKSWRQFYFQFPMILKNGKIKKRKKEPIFNIKNNIKEENDENKKIKSIFYYQLK